MRRTAGSLVSALLGLAVVIAVIVLFPFWKTAPDIAAMGDAERGEYVLRMGGCAACHTQEDDDSPFLAGGRELWTPFGTVYSSNITPDPETGIGGWSTGEFVLAMTDGVSPGKAHYYPAFPYTSYTRMTREDLVDLKAYLDTVEPVANEVPPHELAFPYNLRPLLGGWKLLFFDDGAFEPDPGQSEAWNRGAYLVNGPTHCSECHTPRNVFGARIGEQFLAGTDAGPEGKPVPNITPHEEDGIGGWSRGDITFALQTGILPDGDVVGGAMSEVVDDSTSHLEQADLDAIAEYLLSVEPMPDAAPQDGADEEGRSRLGSYNTAN